jgi:YidC/Oxa1 family membrane protein insertase
MTAIPPAAAIVATSLFGQLIDALGRLLAFFYSLIPNYGVSIILLTVAVRLLLFPLTAKQVRSMKRMSQLQPEIKRLQAKYRDDRQKQNEEVMRFYKENQINPAAGCLPLLLQMPVFFALFKVLQHPTRHIPDSSKLLQAFCPGGIEGCDPKGLKFMWMDLSVQAREGPDKVTGGQGFTSFSQALPYFILIVLVVLTGMYQGRMMQARQPQNDNPSPQAAQMQMVAKILPIFMGFISLTMPAGIVLYFLVGNVWQIGQQALIANRDMKLPEVKFVDRDDEVVEVDGAGTSGSAAKTALVADESPDAAAPAKPAPRSGNQRPGARKPAAAGGARPNRATNATTNKAATNKAATNKAATNKASPAKAPPKATTPASEDTTAAAETTAEADGAAARPAPRPMFPWRKAPDAGGNGRDANGRESTGRESTGRATGGRAAGGRGGAAKGGSGTGNSGANRSGTPTSGRVTPKGGNARKPKKRR